MKTKFLRILTSFLLVFAFGFSVQAQTISGTVTDENGVPLPGATVLVEGTSTGVSTDFDGNYSIDASSGDTLVFSFVGYASQSVVVGSSATVNVILTPDIALEEVVVVGYGTVKKSDLTGAVTSIGSGDVEGIPVQSIDQAIRGKVAGLQITQRSGAPGAGSIIRIRGINSIMGGNDPLIILDGFPITGGLDFINPQDIESFEILKDASATAIYGARATNGVIIVTSKKGKSGQMKIDFNSYYGVQDVTKLIDFANAQEYIKIANARAVNDGEPQLYFPNPSSITEDTNWQKEIFRSAPIQNHNITLSGGKEQFRYSISGNFSDQEGIIKGTDYKRYSLRSNIDVKASKRVKVTNSTLLARSARNNVNVVTAAFRAAPTLPVFDQLGNYQNMSAYSFSGVHENPVGAIDGTTRENLQTRIFNNLKATFSIIDGLTFSSSIGVDYSTSLRNNYDARFLISGAPGGVAGKYNSESNSLLNENIFNYNKQFGDIKLDALAGYTWQKFKLVNFSAGSSNFVSDDLLFNSLSAGSEISIPLSGGTEWGITSWLGRVNLNLHDKYLLTVSGRADGSSRFAEGNKWGFFPSAAFAWKLAKEDWFDVKSISDMKLRASVGQTGNQAISPFQSITGMSDVNLSLGDDFTVGFAPNGIANKELKWETTTQFDAGIDIGFLDRKINLSLDYYYKRTNDLLARVDLPQSAGFTSSIQNIGSVSNQGIEIQLDAEAVSEDDFKWDINANFYKNNNKIIKLAKGADVFAPALGLLASMHILREGEPISQFYGYLWDRIDENNGRHVYKDLNNDGIVNNNDRTIIGSPHPSFSAGLTNALSYKNFRFSIQFDGTFGNDILNASLYESTDSFYKGRNQLKKVVDNYWTPGNANALYPAPSSTVTQLPSDLYLEDASFVKLRYVNLTYSLPVNNMDGIANASVYIAAENLITFSGYSWYDPEVSNYSSGDLRLGTENGTYPQAKTFTIGLKLEF